MDCGVNACLFFLSRHRIPNRSEPIFQAAKIRLAKIRLTKIRLAK
jgi:hypothetical protein